VASVVRPGAPWWRVLLVAALWLVAGWPSARAHDVAGELRLHAFVQAQDGRLQVVLRVPLELLLNLDLPKRGNGYLDLARVDEAFPRALQAAAKDIEFFADGRRLDLAAGVARIALPSDRSFESFDRALAAVRDDRLPPHTDVYWNQGYFDAVLEYRLSSANPDLAIDFHVAPGLRDRLKLDLRFVTASGDVRAFEFATGQGLVPLDPRWFQAASTFVVSGLQHILGGADHLLFLLCLVVPFRRFGWPMVGVVTAFTVAHSVTLVAAALGWMPTAAAFPLLVEVLIAASILYMAVENLLGAQLRHRWWLTAAFGLVHGFGFSFGLAQELQFAGSHLLLSLLAFNVGIELGQLLVLALAWPLLVWARARSERAGRWLVLGLSAFIGHEAWHWLTERFEELAQAEWRELVPLFWPHGASAMLLVVAAVLVTKAVRRPHTPVTTGEAVRDL
jgi:hypothetical protein